jgi:hypothetical protein
MGYYTHFNLELVNSSDHSIIEEFVGEYDGAGWALEPNGDGKESAKWYEHDDDLEEFSKKHPDVLFKLSGEGEDNGDLWHLYVKNGKSQRCNATITFPEYDESKMR